jgi:alkanesulfonate monooxygenase
MSVEFLWTVPTSGDGREGPPSRRNRGDWNPARQHHLYPSVRDERPGRFTYYDYLTQVARAAEATGFTGLFVPFDAEGEDSWIVAASLARETPRLTLVPEFQPGFATAVYTAKLAVTFQRYTADRLGWKLALGGDPAVAAALGDVVEPGQRVRRAEELIELTKGAWFEAPFSYKGQFFDAADTGFFGTSGPAHRAEHRIERRPYPKLYLDGTTEAELGLSARHADVHLFDTVEPGSLGVAIERLGTLAAAHDRRVSIGVRLGVIARDTGAEAWAEAASLSGNSFSSGHSLEDRRVDDHLYLGFDELGFSAPAGLVGSFEDIADRLRRYVELGVTTLVLDGIPRLEEAYRLGERVLPYVTAGVRPVGSGEIAGLATVGAQAAQAEGASK